MIWELIATVCAGLGAAGIALLLRKLSANKAPRWLIPVFAGAAMLGFQIHSEYTWFDHHRSRLPAGVMVVKTIEQTAIWRPWSYLYPQTLRFIAADIANASANQQDPALKLVDLYFFERRAAARRVPQVVTCTHQAQADFTAELALPSANTTLSKDWRPLAANDPLLLALCGNKTS